jgi:hypothetical protein
VDNAFGYDFNHDLKSLNTPGGRDAEFHQGRLTLLAVGMLAGESI